jgi:hypothetical protein
MNKHTMNEVYDSQDKTLYLSGKYIGTVYSTRIKYGNEVVQLCMADGRLIDINSDTLYWVMLEG